MALNGCMVKNSADLTAQNFGPAIATWNTDVYDVGGWHDTGSNTSRMTVPSGVSYVRMNAGIGITSISANVDVFVWIIKNGDNNAASRHYSLPLVLEDSDSLSQYATLASGPVAVSAGDYFELVIQCVGDASVTLEDHSWFSIEEIPSFSGAMVRKSADQTAADYGTADVAMTWDTDTLDVGGWHDTGSDTSLLTVPSGVNYVRITASIQVTSITANTNISAWVTKNGDNDVATRHINLPVVIEDSSSTSQCINLVSGPVPVSAGDDFELRLHTPGDTSITIEDYSWFAIERVG